MSIRRALIAPLLWIPLVALSSYGCDDGSTTSAAPSIVRTQAVQSEARFVSKAVFAPSQVSAVAVPAAFCPAVAPFFAPVNLVIRADGSTDLQLQQMQMHFVDNTGMPSTFTMMSGADLTTHFGSTLIPASTSRTFPVSIPFGCVGGQTGFVLIQVTASDVTGRQETTSVRVNVR
jgi:hypothetical protein